MTLDDLRAIAATCRTVFPISLIGGGAPRDVFLGGPVKDVDLFVQCEPGDFSRKVDELAALFGGTVKSEVGYSYRDAPSVDIIRPDGPPINVVDRTGCVFDDVHDYDFGINQIAVTPSGLLYTPAFAKDMADHTITYRHGNVEKPEWHRKSSYQRMLRLQGKYPDFLVQGAGMLIQTFGPVAYYG